MIYFPSRTDLSGASKLGRAVFQYTTGGPASEAVRCRRQMIANTIDEVAADFDQPRILSVACGHLREAELSRSLARGDVGELVGLDQDEASLDVVSQCYGRMKVSPVPGSVRCLLRGNGELADFDLVYSAGLYDYLSQDLARRLTARLFSMVKPGGRLLIANFLPGIRDVGYMESYMDWNLILRNEGNMLELLAEVPRSEIGLAQLSTDDAQSVVFLQATRKF
jgi:SAM-dependent methyltransferase